MKTYLLIMFATQDLEMLQNYKPWGKQTGGGAPRVNAALYHRIIFIIMMPITPFSGNLEWN